MKLKLLFFFTFLYISRWEKGGGEGGVVGRVVCCLSVHIEGTLNSWVLHGGLAHVDC